MKYIIKKISIAAILTISIVFVLFSIQNYLAKKSLVKYIFSYNTDNLLNYATVRCNLNIFKPEFAFIDKENNKYTGKTNLSIDFHYVEDIFNIKGNDWTRYYLGSTDIKNTTFSELVKMVKEDCKQFKKSVGGFHDKTINWSYSKPSTKKEVNKEIIQNIKIEFQDYPDKVRDLFIKKYGNIESMSDAEILEVNKKIKDEGLDGEIQEQLKIAEDEFQRKVKSGEIHVETNEEALREAGLTEEEIKEVLKDLNEEYVGPQ